METAKKNNQVNFKDIEILVNYEEIFDLLPKSMKMEFVSDLNKDGTLIDIISNDAINESSRNITLYDIHQENSDDLKEYLTSASYNKIMNSFGEYVNKHTYKYILDACVETCLDEINQLHIAHSNREVSYKVLKNALKQYYHILDRFNSYEARMTRVLAIVNKLDEEGK